MLPIHLFSTLLHRSHLNKGYAYPLEMKSCLFLYPKSISIFMENDFLDLKIDQIPIQLGVYIL